MAGRSKAPQTPGRRAFKGASDRFLAASSRLDGIDPEAGEALRRSGAAALDAAVAAVIRKPESGNGATR